MSITLPNALTLVRIALLPIIVVAFYLPQDWARTLCAAVFALAGATDWLDGYIARKLGQTSSFGSFLDPVADKVIVAVSLILLAADHKNMVLTICTLVIISREIIISALREWMAELGQRQIVSVSWIGKIKTALQMLAIFLLLYQLPVAGYPVYQYGLYALIAAAMLTLYSMCLYLYAAFRVGTANQ